jgi:hypothetical protein
MFPLIMSLAVGLTSSDFDLAVAKILTTQGAYEESESVLKGVSKRNNDYHFCKMVNAFQMNNKAEAEKHLKALEDTFVPLPRRYQALVFLVRHNIDQWNSEDLGDITRDMKVSGNRLDLGNAGSKTQEIQKEIIRKLDKHIKDMEDKAAASGGKGKDDIAKKQDGIQGKGQQQQPAPDSMIMGGSGKGKVIEQRLREYRETWGTLPPEKRAQIMEEMQREVPAQYKPMIDSYFRSLNRVDRK